MTTILITKTRIYTDTRHFAGDNEEFHSLTKVKKLKEPVLVKWEPLPDVKVDDETNCAAFVDRIHGYAVSGNSKVASTFIGRLESIGLDVLVNKALQVVDDVDKIGEPIPKEDMSADLNILQTVYQGIVESGFVNHLTNTTIILIGEKACYTFQTYSDGVGVGVVRRDNPTCYGSGGPYAAKMHYTTKDPIRSMWAAMWYDDKLTGGMIDIWHLPTEENPSFYRSGICNQRSLKEIKELIHAPLDPGNVTMPDLIAFNDHVKAVERIVKELNPTFFETAELHGMEAAVAEVRNTPAQKVEKPEVPDLSHVKQTPATKLKTTKRRKSRK